MESKISKRIAVLVIAFVLVIGTVIPGMMFLGSAETDEDLFEVDTREDDVVMVYLDGSDELDELSQHGEIIDHYGRNVLMRPEEDNIRTLEADFDVETLNHRTELLVKGYEFDTRGDYPDFSEELEFEMAERTLNEEELTLNKAELEDGREHVYLVQMIGPRNPEWRIELEDMGVEVMTSVHHFGYEIKMTPEQAEKVEELDYVEWVGLYQPGFKIAPELTGDIEAELQDAAEQEDYRTKHTAEGVEREERDLMERFEEAQPNFPEELIIEIEVLKSQYGTPMRELSEVVESKLGIAEMGDRYSVRAVIEDQADLIDIAQISEVYYISPHLPVELHEMSSQILGGGSWHHAPQWDWVDPDPPGREPETPVDPYRHDDPVGDPAGPLNAQMGYTGEGVLFSVADTGIGDGTHGDAGHPDFSGRIVSGYDWATGSTEEGDFWDPDGHGTGVAGVAASTTYQGTGYDIGHEELEWTGLGEAGYWSEDYFASHGFAPEAEMHVSRIFDPDAQIPDDLHEIPEQAIQQEPELFGQTHSWGTVGARGGYPEGSGQIDAAVRDANRDTEEEEPVFITFSGGNDGPGENTVGEPGGTAKNVISVGGTMNYEPSDEFMDPNPNADMWSVGSWGWTDDNRVKPDVAGPADNVLTTYWYDDPDIDPNYVGYGGTSFSSPAAQGAGVALVEWWEENPEVEGRPSPAMLRAMITNTAYDMPEDLTDDGARDYVPNEAEGWGRINLMPFIDHDYEEGGPFALYDRVDSDMEETYLTTGDVEEYTVSPEDEDEPLKITVAWDDKEAEAGADPTLQNDLRLSVEGPEGEVYRGNAFAEDEGEVSTSGFSYPDTEAMAHFDHSGDGYDDANNILKVYIEDPEPGNYDIEVIGHDIPEYANPNIEEPNQDFALVAQNVPAVVEVPDKDGEITFDRDEYPGDDTVEVILSDIILEDYDEYEVNVTSYDSEGEQIDEIDVMLDAVEDGVFEGEFQLSEEDEWDTLQVEHNGEIKAWYHDEDPGPPEEGNTGESMTLGDDLDSDMIDVAVVDPLNPFDNEIEYTLEEYLPEDEYNVETLWNEEDEHWEDWFIDEMENYDTFVIQRFEATEADSEEAAEDFLEELEDGQGVVYLDSHQGATIEQYADGVYQLHNVRNDPTEWDSEALDVDQHLLTINEEHMIFDGVGEVGDTVDLYDPGSGWGSSFDGYSGDELADIDLGAGLETSTGVAVDEDANEILLAAISYDMFSSPGDDEWTEEANQLFANSVEFVSDEPIPDEGHVGVTEVVSPPEMVNSEYEGPVEVVVENFGIHDQMYVPVEVNITNVDEDELVYSEEEEVNIAAGEEVMHEFEEEWGPAEEAEYYLNATTKLEDAMNEYVEQTITVEDIHDVGVNEIISPVEGTSILETDIEAEIQNHGTFFEEGVPVEAAIYEEANLFYEDFDEEIPPEWTIDDTADETWHWDETWDDISMATVEDDDEAVQEEWLISPEIDASVAEDTMLFLDHDFYDGLEGEPYGEISITTDGGTTWEEIDSFTEDEFGEVYYDISEYADGEENVQIGFLYETDDHEGDPWTPDSWEIYEVGLNYMDEVYFDEITADLDIGETKEVEFDTWTPGEGAEGEYMINVSTHLEEDEDPTNTYHEEFFEVYSYVDIGVDEIVNPPEEVWDDDEDVPVEVDVTNYGHFDVEDLPVEVESIGIIPMMEEDFSGDFPPEGWETDDWTQSDSSNAGGEPPEAQLNWLDIEGDYAYLESETVDTSEEDELYLQFHTLVDVYTEDSIDARVLARSESEEDWSDVTPWENPVGEDIGPEHYEIEITDHIGPETQVMFEFEGPDWDINDWYVNDVMIGYGDVEYEDEVVIDLDIGETQTVEFDPWTPSETGEFEFEAIADHPEDEYPENATLTKDVEVWESDYALEATSIDAPEELIYDFEQDVMGTVTNIGNRDIEDADVEMVIEPIHQMVEIDEDFAEDPIDNGWQAWDQDGNDNTWEWNEDEEYMEVVPEDDHEHNILWTEEVDLTDADHRVMLEFFSDYEADNSRDLVISTDGGDSHQRIGSNIAEGELTYDITDWATEEDQVMIGWEYYTQEAQEGEFWSIDDVVLTYEYTEEEYSEIETIDEIDVGEEMQVEFPDWTPDVVPSDYLVEMTTMHEEIDEDHIYEEIFVEEHVMPEASDPDPEHEAEDVTHSPTLSVYIDGTPGVNIETTFHLYDDEEEVGTETVTVEAGSEAEVMFELLDTDTTFEWYVEMDDGIVEPVESDTWEFTTYEPEPVWKTATADINAEPPEPPEDLTVDWDAPIGEVEGNELTWDASPDDGAGEDDTEYYIIYRSYSEDGPWDETTEIDTVDADGSEEYSYLDEGRAYDGQQWHYVVRAEDRVGNREYNEEVASEMPLPDATDPEPEDGEFVEDLVQDISVDVTSPTDDPLDVEFYDGLTDELIAEESGVIDERVETTIELEEEDRAQDHYWYVITSYEDYNVGQMSPPPDYDLEIHQPEGEGDVYLNEEIVDPEEWPYVEEIEEFSEVTLEAEPGEMNGLEFEFKEWVGDVPEDMAEEEEITLLMDQDRSVQAVFELPDVDTGWHWMYEQDHRQDPTWAIGELEEMTWYSAIVLDLSDEVGMEISEVAYHDPHWYTEPQANSVQAHVSADDDGAPAEPWESSSEVYEPAGGEGWIELELDEPVQIEDPGEYWIVLEVDEPGEDHFPVGSFEGFVDQGGWWNDGDPHDPADWDQDTMSDPDIDLTFSLEAYVDIPEFDGEAQSIGKGSGLETQDMHSDTELDVAVIDDVEGYGQDWVDLLEDELPEDYGVEHVDSSDALEDLDAWDAYFVHGIDSANVEEWFDETDDVGTIYTEKNFGPETITQRSDNIDDPETVTTATDLQTWTITDDHPIIDPVADVGDTVTIHTDDWGDGASFGDTEAEVFADAADGNNAFAVDEDRQDVMMATVGMSTFVGELDITDDAKEIIANSVDHVAEEPEPEPTGWHFHLVGDEDPVAVANVTEEEPYYQGDTIELNATESYDPQGAEIEEYHWDVEDPTGEVTELEGEVVEYTLEYALDYDVELTVYDPYGYSDTDSMEIHAIDTEDPVADAGTSDIARAGSPYPLNGTGSTDNVGIEYYEWTIEGTDGEAEGYHGETEGEIVDYVFPYEGNYEVTLEVFDYEGNSDTDSITIIAVPPLEAFEITHPETDYDVIDDDKVTVQWEGHGYYDDLTYEVRIGYGDWVEVGTDTEYTFVGLEDGIYEVEVRATDEHGNTHVASRIFEIDTVIEELEIIEPEDGVESLTYDEEFTIVGETDPEMDVYINNEPVDVDDEGVFEYHTTLVEGQNVFRVIAEHDGDKVAETTVYALYLPQIPEMQDDIDDLEDDVQENREDIDDLFEITDDLDLNITELEDELHAEVDRLEEALEENRTELEDAIEENRTDLIEIIDENITYIEGELEDIEDDIEDLWTAINDIETTIGEMQDEIDQNREDIDDLELDIIDLEHELESEITRLETALDENVTALEHAINDNADDISEAQDDIEDIQDNIGDINDELTDINTDIQIINTELEYLEGRIGGLEDDLDDEIDDLKTYVDDELADIEGRIGDLEDDLDYEIESLRNEMGERIDDLEDKVDYDLGALENRTDERIDELEEDLEQQIDDFREEQADVDEDQDDDIDFARNMGLFGLILAIVAILLGIFALMLVKMKKNSGSNPTKENLPTMKKQTEADSEPESEDEPVIEDPLED